MTSEDTRSRSPPDARRRGPGSVSRAPHSGNRRTFAGLRSGNNGQVLHLNRRRAETFGDYAEQYDRVRPTYPSALVDWVCPANGRRVLDVGCGTGKAALLFAARNCAVLGIEIDERMAAIAESHGIPVEVSSFETWDAAGRRFDLVVSGQAWHWVDPAVGPTRAADVLDGERPARRVLELRAPRRRRTRRRASRSLTSVSRPSWKEAESAGRAAQTP